MNHKNGAEESHDQHQMRHVQVVYARKMQERQIFMEELKEMRSQRRKMVFKTIRDSIGPRWYQALSVPQRYALDQLKVSIYQDILEGRPTRTGKLMNLLGIYPRPKRLDLMNCVYMGRDDPKEMLAVLYYITYGYHFDMKRPTYCYNAKLILSSILYLGLDDLIVLLRERFKPDKVEVTPIRKPKQKLNPPLESPYLQKFVATAYERPRRKRAPPPPLPNLDDLNNEPFEEAHVMKKPPPPPPPPPPPKARLPESYCEKLSGYRKLEFLLPNTDDVDLGPSPKKSSALNRRGKISKISLIENAKNKPLGVGSISRKPKKRKPVAPSTGLGNTQYLIQGVCELNGRSVYILGSVSITSTDADMIHGGHKFVNGEFVNIHLGYRFRPPELKADPCDCLKRWNDEVFDYVKRTKCYCRHYYDFENAGTFPVEDPAYFQKPSPYTPYSFNYQTIYELDPKLQHIEREFKRHWETDSALNDGITTELKAKKKKEKRRAELMSSNTCLGINPVPEDYLKCALRFMGRVNIAARLPDVYLVPELVEWMRRRLYGPYTRAQKFELLNKSFMYWTLLKSIEAKGFGHVFPPRDPKNLGLTTWAHKQTLNDQFKIFTRKYKRALFKSYANLNNLLWTTMCQAQLPDKKFRQIYFSYLAWRDEDVSLLQPYSPRLAVERMIIMSKKAYRCPPKGAGDVSVNY